MCSAHPPQSGHSALNSVSMIKEETVKDDGRTLIYYSFPEDQDASASPATPEAAHV